MKHTPATPLPHIVNKRNEICSAADYRTVALFVHATHAVDDAAYYAHAANAYPCLLEVLEAILTAERGSRAFEAVLKNARALLRSLGEAE